jgi:predicted O-methyltransferase YrrM
MNNQLPGEAFDFITNLTGAAPEEIKEYAAEIKNNLDFHRSIERKRNSYGKVASNSYYGIGRTLGTALYTICRKQKPHNILETGVASGISSSHFLVALETNQNGRLYSIDLPVWQKFPVGWMIPDYLRHRWHLIQGRSAENMMPLLIKLKEIDIFFHDSDHSYDNMLREFEASWEYLKTGGLLLSHNIDYSDAFPDFCRNHHTQGFTLGNMGGIVKC